MGLMAAVANKEFLH